jgi:hypothetical protein
VARRIVFKGSGGAAVAEQWLAQGRALVANEQKRLAIPPDDNMAPTGVDPERISGTPEVDVERDSAVSKL